MLGEAEVARAHEIEVFAEAPGGPAEAQVVPVVCEIAPTPLWYGVVWCCVVWSMHIVGQAISIACASPPVVWFWCRLL